MKLLIGYDGSECAEAAVRDLTLAGLPPTADSTVLSVADMLIAVPYEEYLPPPAGANPPAKLVATARALAADAMGQAREASAEGASLVRFLFPGWAVRAEAAPGSPYAALVKEAERSTAHLIVVGSHGRSGLGRLFLGSVSQSVLAHAACSVRVARHVERPAAAAPPRVVLAVDGSADSDAAVDAVAKRAWPTGTEVRVLTAVDPQLAMAIAYRSADPVDSGDEPDALSAARRHAELIAARLGKGGVAASAWVESADPKRLLVDDPRRWNADCIFLGAKGHSRLERFLLGSVSAAVAARAHCTVEVVRP